jgi:hypothetical protein
MMVRSMTDAEMVLGYRPDVPLPTQPGHALVDSGAGTPTHVVVDWLADEQWRQRCADLGPTRPVPTSEPQDRDPLLDAAIAAVEAAGGQLGTGAILAALPADLAPPDAVTLGKRLSALGWPTRTVWRDGASARVRDVADCP